jgi:hypothetical protein
VKAVTTSWDDGDVKDLRLAELLKEYGINGTFYVPLECDSVRLMKPRDIRKLRNAGFEIGSHGLTHTPLPATHNPERELLESRLRLEDIIGDAVLSFCYPLGKFNGRSALFASDAGYRLARTTRGFSIKDDFDCLRMPVSLQFYNHSRQVLLRHELKGGNLNGIGTWISKWRMNCEPLSLASAMLDDISRNGGIFHLWGHSWEIDRYELWGQLEELLKLVSRRSGMRYLTNCELVTP